MSRKYGQLINEAYTRFLYETQIIEWYAWLIDEVKFKY